MAAYKLIGRLACEVESTPQSMSVDRLGKAYVFYSSGHLYYVSTTTAECTPTSYVHPVEPQTSFNQLGMGFTATKPGVTDQVLYIHSPVFGLATVDLQTLAVNKLNALPSKTMELTGGPDAVLFGFEASVAALWQNRPGYLTDAIGPQIQSEGRQRLCFRPLRRRVLHVYRRGAAKPRPRCSIRKPTPKSVRDADIGVTVVGAGPVDLRASSQDSLAQVRINTVPIQIRKPGEKSGNLAWRIGGKPHMRVAKGGPGMLFCASRIPP